MSSPAIPSSTSDPDLAVSEHVQQAVAAALDRKAVDLRVLGLESVTDFTDYFLLMSGTSERQVQSIAEAVERRLRDQGVRPLHAEGQRQGHWVLLDYGDFVVHVFDEERRRFYALERLWGDAPDVSDRFLGAAAPEAVERSDGAGSRPPGAETG